MEDLERSLKRVNILQALADKQITVEQAAEALRQLEEDRPKKETDL